MQKEHLERYREQALKILEEFHGQRPWLIGLSVGEISRKLKLKAADADEIIAYFLSTGEIVQQAGLLRLKSHAPKLKSEQQRLVSRIHTALSASPLSAPLKKDFIVEDPGFEVSRPELLAASPPQPVSIMTNQVRQNRRATRGMSHSLPIDEAKRSDRRSPDS